MGIIITVETILPPESRLETNAQFRKQVAYVQIQEICKAFGWDTLPWHEPADFPDTVDTSYNYSKYALVLRFAEGTFPDKEHKLKDDPFSSFSQEERYRKFRHFLDRDEYTNFYIAVDFDAPKHLENSQQEETFVVASSIRLAEEMVALQALLLPYIKYYGENTPAEPNVEPYMAKHTWGDLYEFCDTLHTACKQSIELNLPVKLRW